MGLFATLTSILAASAISTSAAALPQAVLPPLGERATGSCSNNMTKVMPWATLTPSQQAAYLNATLCLMEKPAKQGLGGAKTLWGELHWTHIYQVSWIHYVGAFFGWHRYYLSLHHQLLRDECGYAGPLAYWDEPSASQQRELSDDPIFEESAFGGDGSGDTECIADGPFSEIELDFVPGGRRNKCIFRDLDVSQMGGSRTASVNECLEQDNFEDMWHCVEDGSHASGHNSVGGLMANPTYSPGDPTFFLHHHFIDLVYWRWQGADPATRLQAIGGTNQESDRDGTCEDNPNCHDPAVINYFNDGGDTTTLNHNLWMMGMVPNVTIADVMSTSSPYVCFDYQW